MPDRLGRLKTSLTRTRAITLVASLPAAVVVLGCEDEIAAPPPPVTVTAVAP
jgi:hypothetical protein